MGGESHITGGVLEVVVVLRVVGVGVVIEGES